MLAAGKRLQAFVETTEIGVADAELSEAARVVGIDLDCQG